MMPDLGKYAEAVLSAYAISLLLIIALVGVSLWQAKQVKQRLATLEAEQNG